MKKRDKFFSHFLSPKKIKPEKFNISGFLMVLGIIVVFHITSHFIFRLLGINENMDSFADLSTEKLLSATIIAPCIEEIIFRTHLSGKRNHSWSAILMYALVIIILTNRNMVLMILLLLPVPVFIIGFLLSDPKTFTSIFIFVFHKYFHWTFYITALCFAIMHLPAVHKDVAQGYPVSVAVTLCYFTPIAILFGFIRRKFGLISSMAMHALNNIAVLSLNSLYVIYSI